MIRPVILSGGGGTRLWPLSTSDNPKQFQRLIGDSSLLQATAERCRGERFRAPVILAGEGQLRLVCEQLDQIGAEPEAVILEPVGRNTAPAIAAAACWSLARGEDDPLLVMPSDHVIGDITTLHEAVDAALPYAVDGKLLTFGIEPTAPSTGYGYIHAGSGHGDARPVERFVEKPAADVAAAFLKEGGYFWNSGLFLFRPSAFIRELRRYAPEVAAKVEQSMTAASVEGKTVRPQADAFTASPNISVDYAVMEHSADVLVVPVSFDWSDVGSWDAIHAFLPADAEGNVLKGKVVAVDVANSLVRNDSGKTVAIVGMEGIACIVTEDAVFIAPLDRSQDAKRVVEELGKQELDRGE